jgi:hypothetical protein
MDGAPNIMFTTPGDDLVGDAGYRQGGRQGQLMKLAGWIDLDSKLTVYLLSTVSFMSMLTKGLDWLCRCYSKLSVQTEEYRISTKR